ncbi:MAG: dihydrolipoyl dehydrogenase [Endomicrobiales bacterium]|nr:dihydrolipoyl dehydrogenase [Endomicrobiales bacterium]
MKNKQYDLIILGGGPAGYSAAIKAAQMGASALIMEKESLGGTCLNRGCVPTKFLWETLNIAKKIRKSSSFGITASIEKIDFAAVQQRKAKTTETLLSGLKKLVESYSIDIVEGPGRFCDKNNIEITTRNNETLKIKAKNIIIATGSSPKSLKNLNIGHKKIIDSTDALNLREIPKSLLVVGGGVIGIELATIMAGFGSQVQIVEKESQVLPGEDSELAQEAKKILERQGINVQTSVDKLDDYINKSEKILVAVGRKPNIESLALEKAGIKYSQKGIEVTSHFETTQPGIYACGDVTGNSYLAYTAQAEGILAAENALGNKAVSEYPPIVRVVFSFPPIASVGAGENYRSGNTVSAGRFPFASNSKAFILGERTGWVKVIADKKTGRIFAGQIIGPEAGNLISVIALAIKHKMTVKDLSREMFFHPALSETIHGACEDFLNRSVELPKK